MIRSFVTVFALTLALLQPTPLFAQQARTLCVYDPSGASGDAFAIAKEYRAAALAWGVSFELKPYVDERTAAEDFKAGKCHAAMMTGVRIRAFNKFSSTLEAMGGLQTYEQLREVAHTLASPKAAQLLRSGEYETVALFPAGAVYLYVNDRAMRSVGDLAGKRIATLDYDVAAKTMVKQVGASMVVADVGTFAGMFNNGSVHACYAPATAYQPLELKKGLGDKGGIVRYPLAQLTLQVVARASQFPKDFGQKSREWVSKEFGRFLKIVTKADKTIPAKYWIDVPKPDREKYDILFRDVRVRLRDNDKIFDPQALKLLRRIRCKSDPTRAECAEQKE